MKFAVCNELFGSLDPFAAGRIVKEAGYGGIEFAPFTFFGGFSPGEISAGTKAMRKVLDENGLAFAGFHWLMVSPRPLSLVSAEAPAREAARDHLLRLLDAAGELGGGSLILGSPKQRTRLPGQSRGDAKNILKENLAELGGHALSRNSRILLEALDHNQCDVVNTLAESQELIAAAASPGISGMFDFHNVGDETESWESLIRCHRDIIGHVHINEMDGGVPGSGASDYVPAFRALGDIGYAGWISMEIFNQPEDPAQSIGRALAFMRKSACA
ncbi:MAG: sugar phosphate isomerase/epimerase [Spirochaetia bacterium]|jgi:sugar phosphate isomerase/epimerase|nr:sugar phosphate isomerase/epimerase [Spirochaetia bacterium]